METKLNKWQKVLSVWCPAQMYYYFLDSSGGQWCIYLRWDGQRGDEPWSAELVRCNADGDFLWDDPRPVNLLEEKEHIPGVVTGYYYDYEYPFLQKKVLEMMKELFPGLDFPNNE